MADWKAKPEMVAQARQFLDSPQFRLILDVLDNEAPVHGMPTATTPHDGIRRLGQIEGYQMCLNNLLALGVRKVEMPMPKSEFGVEYPAEMERE